MYYIFGDIHGSMVKLEKLYNRVSGRISDTDTVIFLGDYIDRGKFSFEVIEFLRSIASDNMFFLKGNHEAMLFDYIAGEVDHSLYTYNGGDATIRSYKKHTGSFNPGEEHRSFFEGLIQYYEGEDFIAVHAGLRPYMGNLSSQTEQDMLWIREKFYRADYRWDKTVVFGHTPTFYIHGRMGEVYDDEKRNIIGIDTGAVYGGKLTCLVWPEKTFIQV
ncbi:MAG TPA: metallophosphoesterase family protein [Spirochaetota bacterium]|nr:metallophosphoesterase family protein [Spirochaetota bacterium]HPJ36934.1 metallophosphoesterase family protein [Spirochaetota bacterium]HPQ52506.1 metallophosphoesterase family protein [Spirochaetota bacterium]